MDNLYAQDKENQKKELSKLLDELFILDDNEKIEEESLYQIERKSSEEETFQCINFLIDKEWYGIEITKVKEIIKVPPITYLPSTPSFIAGICNLRGNILTIIDVKKIFGLSETALTNNSRVVVVESGKIVLGFLVDEVSEVVELPISSIDAPLVTLEGEKGDYIIGETKIDEKLIAILDIDKLIQAHCILSSEI